VRCLIPTWLPLFTSAVRGVRVGFGEGRLRRQAIRWLILILRGIHDHSALDTTRAERGGGVRLAPDQGRLRGVKRGASLRDPIADYALLRDGHFGLVG